MCVVAEPSFIPPTAASFLILIQDIVFTTWGTIIRASLRPSRMSLANADLQCCRATCPTLQGNLPRGFASSPGAALPRSFSEARAVRVLKPPSNLPVHTRDVPAFCALQGDFMA